MKRWTSWSAELLRHRQARLPARSVERLRDLEVWLRREQEAGGRTALGKAIGNARWVTSDLNTILRRFGVMEETTLVIDKPWAGSSPAERCSDCALLEDLVLELTRAANQVIDYGKALYPHVCDEWKELGVLLREPSASPGRPMLLVPRYRAGERYSGLNDFRTTRASRDICLGTSDQRF